MKCKQIFVLLALTTLLSCSPSVDKLLQDGNGLFTKGEYSQAQPYFEKILQQEPQHQTAVLKMAVISYHLKQWEACIKYANQALQQKSDFFDVYAALAQAYNETKQPLLYEKTMIEAIKKFPERIELKEALAQYYFNNQAPLQAADVYRELAGPMLDNKDHVFNAAMAYDQAGKYREAGAYFRRLLKLDPQNANAYYGLGSVLEHQNDLKAATGFYLQALERNGSHLSALFNIARLYDRQKQSDKALQAWKNYLKEAEPKPGQEEHVKQAREHVKRLSSSS